MLIRHETPADVPAIRMLVAEAFRPMPFSHRTEHLIVDELRRTGALAVSLVAENDGAVVGHIAFSPVAIDNRDIGWFALGPVAVDPRLQRRGLGGTLIGSGLDRLRALGAQDCIVLGSTAYYPRFGFRHDARLVGEDVPGEHFMVQDFGGGVPTGTATFHPAFWIAG